MDNKVLVKIYIPELDTSYDVFVPINLRIGTIIQLFNNTLKELVGYDFNDTYTRCFYNYEDAKAYDVNNFVRETNIRNGSVVVFV